MGVVDIPHIAKHVHRDGVDFLTVFQALKARYQIPKYTFLLEKGFDEALCFINSCELRASAKKTEPKPAPKNPTVECTPCCGLTPIAPDSIMLCSQDADQLLTLIYYMRYLFRDAIEAVYKMMLIAQSPVAGHMYDAIHEIRWGRWLDMLARHGHDIRDLSCYQHWLARHTA